MRKNQVTSCTIKLWFKLWFKQGCKPVLKTRFTHKSPLLFKVFVAAVLLLPLLPPAQAQFLNAAPAPQLDTGQPQKQELDRIVAIVNNNIITASELNTEVVNIKMQLRQQGMSMPPDSVLRKQILDRMILLEIQLQDAELRHIRVDDESVNRMVENIAQQNKMHINQFRQVLANEGVDYADFRENIRDELTINRLQQREVQNRIKVTDQEVEDFLANQKTQGSANDEYRIGHILITVPEAASAEHIQKAKQQTQQILAELQSGADFAQTAIAKSAGQQALSGGDLGWRKLAQLPTLFADLVVNMNPGDTSDMLRSPSGFHIIKLLEKRSKEPTHVINQTKVRHILVKPSVILSMEEAKKRIERLKQRIDGGEDFAELAIANSDDNGSASQGGDLGWVNPGTMVKPFEEAMNRQPIGPASAPVETQFGWHLIQVLDRREYDNTEEYKRNNAREMVRQRKTEPALANWLRRMRDEAFVEIRL